MIDYVVEEAAYGFGGRNAVSTVYLQRGGDREAFVQRVFQICDVPRLAAGKRVLLKPNIVSQEPYPTTTHPSTLEACIGLLKDEAREIVVADGPAFDARDHQCIIEEHPLRRCCDRLGVTMIDLLSAGERLVRTRSLELEVSRMAFEFDLIISLPVLKSHGICDLTGALKNMLGFLSVMEKRKLHRGHDVHLIIPELNEVVRPDLHIMDAMYTMVITNEARHGGKPQTLGYMLAGMDPLSLDAIGFELLSEVEPRLKGKQLNDIAHLRHTAELGLWDAEYNLVEW